MNTNSNQCPDHPEYAGKLPPRCNCERCWQVRKHAVGCIKADIERDDFLAASGLPRRTYRTVISVPWGGRGHLM